MQQPQILMTPEEVAKKLRVTRRTVYTWLREGRLEAERAGHLWRIDASGLERFLMPPAPVTPKSRKARRALSDFIGCLSAPADWPDNLAYLEGYGE